MSNVELTTAMTMGSLFDGIGGFPLGAARYGIKTIWASEIEPFPMEVTKRRFPQYGPQGGYHQAEREIAVPRGYHLRRKPMSRLCRGNSYSEVIAGNPVNQEISAKTSE